MTDVMKKTIRDNIHFIDENDYDTFYEKITNYAGGAYKDVCDVTVFLMDTCEIDPMSQLSYIPKGYLFKCQTLNDIIIQDGIKFVGVAAYLGSSIHKVTLPKTCEAVAAQAFSGCMHLMDLRIENPDITIDSSAFTQTHDIGWIMYNGTMEQFKNKTWPDEMIDDSYVICLDGTIHMVKGVAKK